MPGLLLITKLKPISIPFSRTRPLPRTMAEAHLYYHPPWLNSTPGWQRGDLRCGRSALVKDVELDAPSTVYPHRRLFLNRGYGVIGLLSIGELICSPIMWIVLQEHCGRFDPQQSLLLSSPIPGYGRAELRGAVITSWQSSTDGGDMVRVTNIQLKMAELIDHA